MTQLAASIKSLLRQPRYTILAVVTLAAGVGANAAMFGLLDAVYFRPLPLTDPAALVDVTLVSPANRFSMLSYEEFRDIERSITAFEDVMAIGRRGVTWNRNGETEPLLIHYVSGRCFPSLGIPMQLGRGFRPADDDPRAAHPQVVINHHLWQERLGSPPDIIGRSIQLNGRPFTVIGVTARGFVGLQRTVRTDVWVTTAQAPLVVAGLRGELDDRRRRWFGVIGRLRRGVDARQAASELDLLLARWRSSGSVASPDYLDARLIARPQAEANREASEEGAVFLALVGLVLFVACANVANLTLARSEGRRREMAVRAALGAPRLALVRQTFSESALVACAGAAAGVLVAAWAVRFVPALLPPGTSSIMLDIRIDGRLLAFAALLALLATALVGVAAAWRASRADITSGLKAHSSTTTARGGILSLRDLLVAGEIALAVVIVIAAGLLVRSLTHSLGMSAGFDSRKSVATFYVVPGLKGYDNAGTYRFLDESRRAAGALAGVKRASYAIRLPAQGNEAGWAASFVIPGKEPPPGRNAFEIRYTMVGPGYFEVMGTRILNGRGIADEDRPDSVPVAVISESMAQTLWPGENPIGQRIRMGRQRPVDREIVGVAEDIRIGGLYEPHEMYVYVPFAQDAQSFGLLLVETESDALSIAGAVRQRLAQIDPALPILTVSSFADHMDRLLFEDRRNAWVASAVALLAVTLAAVGVHGVVSLVAARRTKEIGIRAMLGAGRGELLRTLLGRNVRLVLGGAALGIAGAAAAGRLLESQLHGIHPLDPTSFVIGTLVCVSVALAANVSPVWRATRRAPAAALREE
jgi:predicted permease